MRRRIIALALLCSACLPFVTPASGLAQTEGATVAFTIHAATCPLDYGGGSIYEACHENFLGGATYLLSGTDLAATQIVTGVDGVGEVQILSGVTSASDVVLAEDPIGPGRYAIRRCPCATRSSTSSRIAARESV